MQYDPFRLIEGCLIAARAIGAERGWIYIRGEYRYLVEHLNQVLDAAYQHGWLGANIQGSGMNFDLATQSGAGAYECGEESALLESLEGKRGNPRLKPPFPAQVGAFQCPTVLNNVETFAAVPDIILRADDTTPISVRRKTAARACSAFPGTSTAPASTKCVSG